MLEQVLKILSEWCYLEIPCANLFLFKLYRNEPSYSIDANKKLARISEIYVNFC